ncbi:M56 family metallopeptidase [Cellulophaga sp. Hel_I_12]|uniref:M56 family metallopeptidase n=1 Tax=Cellulophaga sp. Hel_I_12 TaxID=1249972 RepID=UPI00068F90FA|nr:M56 family metallopeptidase [Cellulophaga sp. Hel_I_12]
MLIYIVKVTTCLAIFYAFYKLLLERESMHSFKRFYLLAAVGSAFVIPALIFTEYVYVTPEPTFEHMPLDFQLEEFQTTAISKRTGYLSTILWSVYALGVLVFGFKFVQNLFIISNRIKKNTKIKEQTIIHVLLKEQLAPHTFFNFIFFNQQKFTANEIPTAVVLHEKTHAHQKHSIDVLLMELVQVFFWFNPFVYLFKNVIKLNHEFLADQAVMQKGIEITTYQKILLAFSSNAASPETALTNAINYSSIKKRFTVMKKNTSKKAVWLRSLLVLPLFALVLYSFSATKVLEVRKSEESANSLQFIESEFTLQDSEEINYTDFEQQKNDTIRYIYITKPNAPTAQDVEKWKKETEFAIWVDGKPVKNRELNNYNVDDFKHYSSSFAYQNVRSKSYPQPYQVSLYTKIGFQKQFTVNDRKINILINRNGKLLVQNELVAIEELKIYLSKINTDLNKEERSQLVSAQIHVKNETPKQVIKEVNTLLEAYGCATINIVGPSEFQDGATKKQISEYNAIASKYSDLNMSMPIKKSEIDRMEYLYNLMTDKQKKSVTNYPELPPMPPAPPKVKKRETSNIPPPPPPFHKGEVSKSLESAYNSWVKTLKNADGSYNIITKEEYRYFSSIYENMTNEQKKNAEIIPPPPPPTPPKVKKGETSNIPPPPAPENNAQEKEKSGYVMINNEKHFYNKQNGQTNYYNKYGQTVDKDGKIIPSAYVKKGEESSIPPPPPPPASPLDHLIDMAKKDATFYYEDKEISSDKAIELLKKNKNLNIDSKGFNSDKPIVLISKNPIKTKN